MKTFILLQFLILTNLVNAQPGQLYFPPSTYYYSILDETGKPIQFSGNSEYAIIIANIEYLPHHIPTIPKKRKTKAKLQDSLRLESSFLNSLELTTFNEPNLNHYVRVNDLYLNLKYEPSSIKIAHGKDTMHLFQKTEIITELAFSPGYHYLPGWFFRALKTLPKLEGAQFINIDQKHFLVSKAEYNSLRSELKRNVYSKRKKVSHEMAQKFIKEYVNIDYDYQTLKTERAPLPYEKRMPKSPLYPTRDDNVYMSMTGFRFEEGNCISFKDYFTRIDLNEHTLEYWFPVENTREFGSSTRFFKIDPFNQVIYLRTFFYKDLNRIGQDCASWAETERIMYKSYDYGETWKKDEQYTQLYNQHEFKKYEFIDQHYSIGYKFQDIPEKTTNYMIDQGVFYLLKDGTVVDTFLTPENVRFNTNYANYYYKQVSEDSILLGSWGHNPYNNLKSDYHQIYAIQKDHEWKLEIITAAKKTSKYEEEKVESAFENFTVIGDTLIFNKGAKMVSRLKLTNNHNRNGLYVLEQGEHIYLINTQERCMYMSFDGGANWIFNPESILHPGNMMLLNIDSDNKISLFNRSDFAEETYRFIPTK